MLTKFEMRGKPTSTPFSSPLPAPSSTVSMKMPQNTPNAVNTVRSLCRASVLKISCHFSMSNMALLGAHRFDGRDLRGAHGRREPREDSDADEEQERGDRDLEVHFRVHEVRQLRACAANAECKQLEQSDTDHQADIARDGRDQRRLQQQRAHDRERRCAERLANADLARALLDGDDHDVADTDEPEEDGDAGEQTVHARRRLRHVEGLNTTVVRRRDIVTALEQVDDLALELEAVHTRLGPQPDHVDALAAAVELAERALRHEDALGVAAAIALVVEGARHLHDDIADSDRLSDRVLARLVQPLRDDGADHDDLAN